MGALITQEATYSQAESEEVMKPDERAREHIYIQMAYLPPRGQPKWGSTYEREIPVELHRDHEKEAARAAIRGYVSDHALPPGDYLAITQSATTNAIREVFRFVVVADVRVTG
jgi:hypothetical protein